MTTVHVNGRKHRTETATKLGRSSARKAHTRTPSGRCLAHQTPDNLPVALAREGHPQQAANTYHATPDTYERLGPTGWRRPDSPPTSAFLG
jgi:hypothetical protein